VLRLIALSLAACLLLSGTDTAFSGGLESVGNESIAIRLPDRRVICARLSPTLPGKAIAAQYRMGDQVEISAGTIEPIWDKSISRFQYLEVTAIRLLERSKPISGRLSMKGKICWSVRLCPSPSPATA